MRQEMKEILHTWHVGIEWCKRRSRDTLCWPGIKAHLEDFISSCPTCREFQNQQRKETLIPHHIPFEIWSKVGTDLFTLRNKDYLIVADYNTKFFEVTELPKTLASTVVSKTKNIFASFGIPKTVISGNGQRFTSEEYKIFSQQWDFTYNTTSPVFSQSNGFIERTIQTVKNSLKKTMTSNEDPFLPLLALWTTPGKDRLSPAQKLMGRTLRTIIPSVKHHLKTTNSVKISKKTTAQYNSKARNLNDLHPGERVRLRAAVKWSKKGEVIARDKNPRSYHVKTQTGNVLRRSRRHLLKTNGTQSPPKLTPPIQSQQPKLRSDTTSEDTMTSPSSHSTRYGRAIKPPQYLY